MAVLITDGISGNTPLTVLAAEFAKSTGIHLIAVGIGLINIDELNAIASAPAASNVFRVNNFVGLSGIETYIRDLFVDTCTGEFLYLLQFCLMYCAALIVMVC